MSEFLRDNAVVLLTSHATNKNVRCADGGRTVTATGARGKFARWIVQREEKSGFVRFQSFHNKKFLRIHGNEIDCEGGEGPLTLFRVHDQKGPVVALESVKDNRHFLAFRHDGTPKPPSTTSGNSDDPVGQFTIVAFSRGGGGGGGGGHVAQQAAPQKAREDGTRALRNGNTVLLTNHASGKNLRAIRGQVNATGAQGRFARWIVHEDAGGVRFQNFDNKKFLRIHQNDVDSDGGEGPFTLFKIHDHPGNVISIESTREPGEFIACLPNGSMKKTNTTREMPEMQMESLRFPFRGL